ncbi:UNVERIFIED_CONTAM: Retrovirus-related Pol polyprotein from transposon TNT 1-94 [Sesamum calycinum]|uniref:Retrovirus-related Pol polyprotein from transposon TNT 1-94 n=1 Tax=Sesamum calycinum TaxID=2727403 RepID=A0AAW2IYE1_9LAMI
MGLSCPRSSLLGLIRSLKGCWTSLCITIRNIQYAVQCTRPDVAYALSIMSKYQACAGEAYWTAVKTILKYLRRTKDMFLAYGGGELVLEGYSDASFQSDDDDPKSQSRLAFKLNGLCLLGRVPSRIPQLIPL